MNAIYNWKGHRGPPNAPNPGNFSKEHFDHLVVSMLSGGYVCASSRLVFARWGDGWSFKQRKKPDIYNYTRNSWPILKTLLSKVMDGKYFDANEACFIWLGSWALWEGWAQRHRLTLILSTTGFAWRHQNFRLTSDDWKKNLNYQPLCTCSFDS